jgi:CHAD domain-containing protein
VSKTSYIESNWNIDTGAAMPSFDDATGSDETDVETHELADTYYDTTERDLLSHNVTIRFHQGGQSAWLIKFPAPAGGRTELRVEGPSSPVPPELTEAVWGLRLGRELTVAAIIHTRRTRHRYLDEEGLPRFDVFDRTVSATVPGPVATATRWREIQVEPGTAANKVPISVRKRLTRSGATPARASSELARALGYSERKGVTTSRPSAAAVEAYVHQQVAEIFAGDVALRRGDDPVHSTRVAIRRLRSTLRTSDAVLDAAQIAGVDDELKWFAGLLGEVRDRQVLRARFAHLLHALPDDVKLGPVAARIEEELLGEERAHRVVVSEAMTSVRYRQLLTILARWNRSLPVVDGVRGKQVRRIARRAARKADKRLAAALESGVADDLHRARKAAKRARYAGELARPVVGRTLGKRQAKRFKKIQTVLGEHQDSAVAAQTLWRLGARAGVRDGENGFTYGVLYQRELAAADAARRHAATLGG